MDMITGMIYHLFIVLIYIILFLDSVIKPLTTFIPEASCYFFNSFSFRLGNQIECENKEKDQQCHENQESVRI